MKHTPDIAPSSIVIDGCEWVPRAAYDAAMERLREKQRTKANHNHQFAEIHDLWANLPHTQAAAPYAKSPDAFRKHGLIETGYCDTFCHVFESRSDMMAIGKVLKDEAYAAHGYALCHYKDNVLTLATPHSQSFKAMGNERFRASKAAVLDWGHAVLGVSA